MDIEVKDGRAYITTKRWCECGGTAACDTQLCPRCAYDTLSERLRGRIAVGDKNGRRLWEGCWEWKGKLRSTGYGQAKIEGKFWSSHRLVYSLLRGHLSEELVPLPEPGLLQPLAPASGHHR